MMLADLKTYATKNDKFFKEVNGHTDEVKNKIAHMCNMLRNDSACKRTWGGGEEGEGKLMPGPAVPAHIALRCVLGQQDNA